MMSEKCNWLYFLFKIDTMISEMVMQASDMKGVVIPYLLKHQLKSAKACIHRLLAIGLSVFRSNRIGVFIAPTQCRFSGQLALHSTCMFGSVLQ